MKRTKNMLLRIAALIVATALVIVGGYFERGYYWPAAEILLIPLGIGWIVYKQKEESE
jgi:hypothetical protein